MNSLQQRTYLAFAAQLERQLPISELNHVIAKLNPAVKPFGLQPLALAGYEDGILASSYYGHIFDYLVEPRRTDLVAALMHYERYTPSLAIASANELCERCCAKLRQHYFGHYGPIQVAAGHCHYCPQLSPHYLVNSAMDPKIFEKFIAYDSFFGNYMVKRFADIKRQEKEDKDKKNIPLDDIEDFDWDPYFDQMLLQVMDHSNDLRVQEYFKSLRHLPLDKVANDSTVPSPYRRSGEGQRSVYDDLQRGIKVEKKVPDTPNKVTAGTTNYGIWEPRTIRRRYSVNNYPIYPSGNVHWVKRVNDKIHTQFQVLNFMPPKEMGLEILSLELTASQGLQLFNYKVAGRYPTSQKTLDQTWERHVPFRKVMM